MRHSILYIHKTKVDNNAAHYFLKDYSGHTSLFTLTLQAYVRNILDAPAMKVTLFLQSLYLTFNYTFLLLPVSIFNWLTFSAGLYIIQHFFDSIPDFVLCKAL